MFCRPRWRGQVSQHRTGGLAQTVAQTDLQLLALILPARSVQQRCFIGISWALTTVSGFHELGQMWSGPSPLDPRGEAYASNSRAELGAILETLRQNERDNLIIESDSLSSLRAICKDLIKYKDLNWNRIINADLLKGILIRLRTRLALTEFRWVKGHNEDNYSNSRADALADTSREQDTTVRIDDEDLA